jgi:PAS domain S-box-containing protein
MKRIIEIRQHLSSFANQSGLVESVFAFSPFAMQVYDSKGHSLFVNQSFRDLFGSVPPPEYCVLKDDQAKATGVLHLFERAFKGEVINVPPRWYDPRKNVQVKVDSGNSVAIETTLFPIFDEQQVLTNVVFVFKDVTAEQVIREENTAINTKLQESNLLIESFLSNTKAVIYFKDRSGRYIKVNRQWCSIFEQAEVDAIGKTDYDIFPKDAADSYVANDRKVMQSRSHIESEEKATLSDGEVHTYFSLKFPMLDKDGNITGICGISTDITEIKRVQQELHRSRRMESLGIMAGGIAHDFNNSLSIIQLQAESVLGITDDKFITNRLNSIINATTSAANLIKQLLAFGRQQPMQARSLNLRTIVDELRKILEQVLGEAISLDISSSEKLASVFADPTQIEQILVNMTINARDAMPRGGKLSVEIKNAVLKKSSKGKRIGASPGDYVELSIRDTGHGMSAEILERIFEPFFTTKSGSKGNGLGLPSVIGIVQQNKGEIIVESTENVGTCFRILFPRHQEAHVNKIVNSPKTIRARKSGEIILLIEDNLELMDATALKLEDAGYRVLKAQNLQAAIAAAKEVQGAIDLIISDVIMPERSGPEIANELFSLRLLKETRVLFTSGHSGNQLEKYSVSTQDFGFLEKPYTGKKLLEKIDALLAPEPT